MWPCRARGAQYRHSRSATITTAWPHFGRNLKGRCRFDAIRRYTSFSWNGRIAFAAPWLASKRSPAHRLHMCRQDLNQSRAFQVNRNVERSVLEQDGIRRAVRDAGHGSMLLSDEDLERSLKAALAERTMNDPVWMFGYGSLIWNPLFAFAERRVAKVRGYHCGFYLWSRINRGSPERPGLILGLDRGGSCGGVAYRLHANAVAEEFKLLWRREMLVGTYFSRGSTLIRVPAQSTRSPSWWTGRHRATRDD